jgi:hypothetical protein
MGEIQVDVNTWDYTECDEYTILILPDQVVRLLGSRPDLAAGALLPNSHLDLA